MICTQCKKEIPEDSVFCMFCGHQQGETPQEVIPSTTPVYISGVDVSCTGPKETRSGGFFAIDDVGRWIEINFNLRDRNNSYTASDGTLVLALVKPSDALGLYKNSDQKIEVLRKRAFYFLERQVHVDEFRWFDYSNALGRKWRELNVKLLINSFIFAPRSYSDSSRHYVYCFFKPSGSEWLEWKPSQVEEYRLTWE